MFVDSSAILAILLSENDAPLLVEKLKHAPKRYINPLVHYEVVRGMVKIIVGSDKPYSTAIARDCSEKFDAYAEKMKLINMPLDAKITRIAIDALALYGKGSGHPARLKTWPIAFPMPVPRHSTIPYCLKAMISFIRMS